VTFGICASMSSSGYAPNDSQMSAGHAGQLSFAPRRFTLAT